MDPKFQNSNEELYKNLAERHQKATKLMFKAILKKTPKEVVIEVLTEEKIIKRDWCENGERYKLK